MENVPGHFGLLILPNPIGVLMRPVMMPVQVGQVQCGLRDGVVMVVTSGVLNFFQYSPCVREINSLYWKFNRS
jgi:hypothetical protein